MWTEVVSGRELSGRCDSTDSQRLAPLRRSLSDTRWGTLARMLVAFSVAPSGGGSDSVGDVVAEAVRVVRESGLPNETTSMFTTIEAPTWDEAMEVVKRAVEAVAARAPRVSLVLKADIRPGWTGQLQAKVERVERAIEGSGED
jgi:uncharacterized protein (TIGR00106 family)